MRIDISLRDDSKKMEWNTQVYIKKNSVLYIITDIRFGQPEGK